MQNFRLSKEVDSLTANLLELKKLNAELRDQLSAEVNAIGVMKVDYQTLVAINKEQRSKIDKLSKHLEKLTNHIQMLT